MAPKRKSAGRVVNPAEQIPDHPLARCKPRGDRVVIRRDMGKTETQGGILLPQSFNAAKQQIGMVWAVGPGNYDKDGNRNPVELEKGQRVLITGYAGLEIRDPTNSDTKNEEFVILREEDVLAILDQ